MPADSVYLLIRIVLESSRPVQGTRDPRSRIAIWGALLFALIGLVACGGSSESEDATGRKASVKAPVGELQNAEQLVYCTNAVYPPMEFQTNGQLEGIDISLGRDIAAAMGLEAQFINMQFDALIPALQSEKCDAVISGVNKTPERAQEVDFANYAWNISAVLLPSGNPARIDTVEDLSGATVGVTLGTAEIDGFEALNDALSRQGKAPIDVAVFNSDADASTALRTGNVDAYGAGLVSIAYVNKQNPSLFDLGPRLSAYVPDTPFGVLTRKGDTALHAALDRAIKRLYADGTVDRILREFGSSRIALNNRD